MVLYSLAAMSLATSPPSPSRSTAPRVWATLSARGAHAFALASGQHLRDAVMRGNAAGSLAVRALKETFSLPNGDAVTKLAGW